jgi:hypothetical protein
MGKFSWKMMGLQLIGKFKKREKNKGKVEISQINLKGLNWKVAKIC